MRRAMTGKMPTDGGSYILVAFLALALLSLAAVGLGWMGEVETNRVTDLPIVGGAQ